MSTTTTTTTSPPQRHHTFWCHECDMSVFLPHPPSPTPTPPRCPNCNSDFLEQMDSFTPTLFPQFPDHNPNPNDVTAFTPSDDNFLLDSPYLHRLIHHLTTTNAAVPAANPHHTPASKSSVEALEEVKISSEMLENDPVIPCPICKDQFLLDAQVKMLPCKHMYHPDCIFPWLEMNNSCPVCRFRLPVEEEEAEEQAARDRAEFIGAMRLEELFGEEEDVFGFRRTLRRVARRHQLTEESMNVRGVSGSLELLFSPTQIGEAGGVVARANSVETVSSWPSWPVESGSEGEVGGGSGSRLGGEGDTVVRS